MLARPSTASAPEREKPGAVGARLLGLDALRGLTVLLMLLVNNAAMDTATPEQFTHAPFGEVNLADLVFPWFLFCMGAAIPYSLKAGVSLTRYLERTLQRSVLLFVFGLVLISSLAHTPIFALGVLQLIALAYLVAALLFLTSRKPLMLLLMSGGLLLSYWVAMYLIPLPGLGPGVFEENQNFLIHIDRYLEPLGLRGLLAVVPTAALALLGAVVGQLLRGESLLRFRTDNPNRLLELSVLGVGLSVTGGLWSLDIPFSKTFWTPPYIVLTAGLATLVLLGFYYLFDQKGWQGLAFVLVVPGSNALLAYVVPILVKVWVLQGWMVGDLTLQRYWMNQLDARFGPVLGGWVYTLGYIAAWWTVLWLFYRKRIFLRV